MPASSPRFDLYDAIVLPPGYDGAAAKEASPPSPGASLPANLRIVRRAGNALAVPSASVYGDGIMLGDEADPAFRARAKLANPDFALFARWMPGDSLPDVALPPLDLEKRLSGWLAKGEGGREFLDALSTRHSSLPQNAKAGMSLMVPETPGNRDMASFVVACSPGLAFFGPDAPAPILELRAKYPVLARGGFTALYPSAGSAIGIFRSDSRERLVAVANPGADVAVFLLLAETLRARPSERLKRVFRHPDSSTLSSFVSQRQGAFELRVPPGTCMLFALPGTKDQSIPGFHPCRLERSFPADKARGLPPDCRVILEFSEPMDGRSAEAAFSIAPPVEGILIWSGNACVFAPAALLSPRTEYLVRAGRELESRSGGEPIDREYSFSFMTQ